MSDNEPQQGYEKALAARQAAHPEVDAASARETKSFEEYSRLYNLDPTEPLGSRIDEFTEHFLRSVDPSDHEAAMPEYLELIKGTLKHLDRVSLVIGGRTFEAWRQHSLGMPNGRRDTDQEYLRAVDLYKLYVLHEACASAWAPHLLAGPPYGPRPRHIWLRRKPRFSIPRRLPPQPTLEPPTHRAATAEDVADCCSICRYVPIKLGETLMVLPCKDRFGHWFHPECILPWFEEKGKQGCVYRCPQREIPVVDPIPAEHNNYNYSFTFPDGPYAEYYDADCDID